MSLTSAQCKALLDLFDYCAVLEMAWQRKEQAECNGGEGANALAKQYDEAVERWDALIHFAADVGVPSERVAYVIDNYLPTALQHVEAEAA